MALNDDVRTVITLLTGGNHQGARDVAERALIGIEEQQTSLSQSREVLQAVLEEIERQASVTLPDADQVAVTSAERRQVVLRTAEELVGVSARGMINTFGIHGVMVERGEKPPNRTGIGIILNNSPDWERVDSGLYRRRVQDVNGINSAKEEPISEESPNGESPPIEDSPLEMERLSF